MSEKFRDFQYHVWPDSPKEDKKSVDIVQVELKPEKARSESGREGSQSKSRAFMNDNQHFVLVCTKGVPLNDAFALLDQRRNRSERRGESN